jgi:hypothetical protein
MTEADGVFDAAETVAAVEGDTEADTDSDGEVVAVFDFDTVAQPDADDEARTVGVGVAPSVIWVSVGEAVLECVTDRVSEDDDVGEATTEGEVTAVAVGGIVPDTDDVGEATTVADAVVVPDSDDLGVAVTPDADCEAEEVAESV